VVGGRFLSDSPLPVRTQERVREAYACLLFALISGVHHGLYEVSRIKMVALCKELVSSRRMEGLKALELYQLHPARRLPQPWNVIRCHGANLCLNT